MRLVPLLALAALALVPLAPASHGQLHFVSVASFSYTDSQTGSIVSVVDVGEPITWVGATGEHTVTSNTFSWGTTANIRPGTSWTHSFDEPGVYPYYCVYHRSMQATVVVLPTLL